MYFFKEYPTEVFIRKFFRTEDFWGVEWPMSTPGVVFGVAGRTGVYNNKTITTSQINNNNTIHLRKYLS